MQNYQKQATILTFAGVTPFILAILLALLNINIINYEPYTKLYGAIIISFICGIHWAFSILNDDESNGKVLIGSNIVALIAWVVTILSLGRFGFAIEAILFAYLLFIDFKLRLSGDYPSWFFKLRLIASIIVILSLGYLTYLL